MHGEPYVFVSYARRDLGRAQALVRHLSEQEKIEVWWDQELHPGDTWRWVIDNKLREAACVLVVFTPTSSAREYVLSEADRANRRKAMIPVKMAAVDPLPSPFDQRECADLSDWEEGREHAGMKQLLSAIRSRFESQPRSKGMDVPPSEGAVPLVGYQSLDNQTAYAIAELDHLSARAFSISETLVLETGPAQDVRGTLDEVRKTYQAVNGAITKFIAAGAAAGPIDPAPYLAMGRGTLVESIRNGRGHCGNIETYYGRYGGLRDFIQSRIESPKLNELDSTFAALSSADQDAFQALAMIGDLLKSESRLIARLLEDHKESEARARIIEGHRMLEPIEDRLDASIEKLQEYGTRLGYAAASRVANHQDG